MPTRRAVAESLEPRSLLAAAADFPYTYGSAAGFDSATKAVTDSAGDVYVTGLFSGTVNFDRAGSKAGSLTARGDSDIYVAKYDAAGALDWVHQIGGDYTDKKLERFDKRDIAVSPRRLQDFVGKVGEQPLEAGEYVNDLALDSSGNAYLVGAFRSSIALGSKTLTADDEFSDRYYDALIVKVSSAGAFTWSKQISGPFDDDALTVAVDGTGSPVVGGYYTRQANFNVGGKANELVTRIGRDSGWIARYSSAGVLAWTYQFTSKDLGVNERNSVNALTVTANGDVYAGGTYASKADFDNTGKSYVLKSEGLTDAFLLHLTRRGQFSWVLSTGGNGYDGNSAIALGPDGSVYTGGYFADDVDVNPSAKVSNIFTADQGNGDNNSQFTDLVISKFTAAGSPVWQDQITGPYFEVIASMTVGANGAIYTAGSFFNTVNFAPGKGKAVLNSTLAANGDDFKDNNLSFKRHETYDQFVQVLTPAGKFVAVKQFGDGDDDYASGISLTNTGSLLLAGRYVRAVGDRDSRQEQAVIYLLDSKLDIL